MKTPLTVVILARNETVNLERSLPALVRWAEDVVVVDSHSDDGTPDLARRLGARVLTNPYEYHAQQTNWALENAWTPAAEWILLLNADELPDEELRSAIDVAVRDRTNTTAGYFLKFKVFFLGRWIRHGGTYPLWVLRLVRRGRARCEDRRMDEKIVVDGDIGYLRGHVLDDNRKDLSYWIVKHDAYASREADDYLRRKRGDLATTIQPRWLGDPAQRRRKLKEIWDRLPLLMRPRLYYTYRLIVRFGFLDGREGRIWHYLQGYWYRYLVDVKILERLRQEGRGE